ncbi:hypothetical protein ACIGXM_00640 [Kitasatospora sp. NPDC052896]|uniref:hypothetical protein n=1 Tax=Kitasatospora sp. NPDC052896 TaxID=3364061 RepID=UPI0037C80FC0
MTAQLAGPQARDDAAARRDDPPRGPRPVRSPWGHRLLPALRRATPALAGYAAVRALGVLAVLCWYHKHGRSGLHQLSSMWDAWWYQQIAQHGYAGTPLVPGPKGFYQAYAFFPAYPMTIRVLGWLLPVSLGLVALLVAWVSSLVAAWGTYAIGARLYGHRAGVIATVLWGVIPYALVESLAYSEPMFTAFAVWAVYAAITRRWIWAGGLSLLAGLTRPTAVAVAGAVCLGALWALVSQWRRDRGAELPDAERVAWWRPVLGALIAPVGVVSFIAWVGLVKGNADAYFKIEDAWASHFDAGASTVRAFAHMLTYSTTLWLAEVVVGLSLGAAVVLFLLSVLQRQPLPLLAFSGLTLVIALGDAAYFNSRARFLLPAVGLLFPLAGHLARVRTRGAVAIVLGSAAVASALYGGYLAFVYTNSP